MSYNCRLRTCPTPASAGVSGGMGVDRCHFHPLDICTESYFTTTVASAHTHTQTETHTHASSHTSIHTHSHSSSSTSPRASSVWCHFTLVQPTKRGRFLNAKDRQYWYSALSLIVLRVHSVADSATADEHDGEEEEVKVLTKPSHRGLEVSDQHTLLI